MDNEELILKMKECTLRYEDRADAESKLECNQFLAFHSRYLHDYSPYTFGQNLRKYTKLVDTERQDGGFENFREETGEALMSESRCFESWKGSLSFDKVKDLDCVQDFLKCCQKSSKVFDAYEKVDKSIRYIFL